MKTILCDNSKCWILLDDEDYERISAYSWHFSNDTIVRTQHFYENDINKTRHIPIANEIMHQINQGIVYDHKDNSIYNNQKENLRQADTYQNAANRRKRIDSLGKYKGVSKAARIRDDGTCLYRARITFHGKTLSLGSFQSQVDAAKAYNEAAIKYFKEFANLNDV